jgi:flagellar motility protein MotE (MotC chaperone)
MYENMRPADAATIFNDLDMVVLLRVSRSMNPRKLGPIMAKMLPEKAQVLTVRMASAEESAPIDVIQGSFAHLPQIVGQ